MEANEKVILVRNGDVEAVAEHINSFIEVASTEGGKKCPIELYKDSIGEFILLFPHNIPYYHFTVLLSAFDAPWVNNSNGLQAAGWANSGTNTLLLFSPNRDTGVLVGVSNTGLLYAIADDEQTPIEGQPLPIEYFNYTFEKDKLERIATFELLVDETVLKEDEEVDDEAPGEIAQVPAKKISALTILVAIVLISALLIWVLSMAS